MISPKAIVVIEKNGPRYRKETFPIIVAPTRAIKMLTKIEISGEIPK